MSYFCVTKHNNMTSTNTLVVPAVKVNTDSLAGDVFYGSFKTHVKGKYITVSVSNHLQDLNKEYEFRSASKCRAGFINISDWKGTPGDAIRCWGKNTLVNIQAKNEYGTWMNVYTTKGGKWHSIDLGFLKTITVGTMRESFPDMCDMELWKLVDTKTWADKAFAK